MKGDCSALSRVRIVDLNKVASSVVAVMAPWAIAQQRVIAFVGTQLPVEVNANAHALENALRNLIENAVVQAPAGTEVTVTVDRVGRIEVADCGSGVPRKDRENIFKRFRRGGGEKEGRRGPRPRHRQRNHESASRQCQRRRQSTRQRPLHPLISIFAKRRVKDRRQVHDGRRGMSGGDQPVHKILKRFRLPSREYQKMPVLPPQQTVSASEIAQRKGPTKEPGEKCHDTRSP